MFLKKNRLNLISILLLLHFTGYSQPGGYLNKRHEISFDFTELIHRKINIEYKYSFYRHCALWLNAGQQFYKGKLYLEETDINENYIQYGAIKGQSTEYGIGLLFNTPLTGMALPLGNYFGMCYVRDFSPSYTEKVDSTESNYRYANKGYSIRWVLGREFYIARNFVFDFNFTIGYSIGQIKYLDQTERAPDNILPLNSIFDFHPYHFRKDSNEDYYSFHFMPNLKIGYLF